MIKLNITHPMKTSKGDVILQIDKEFKQGDFISIYGESGAGKTTILRSIAGLIRPQSGLIKIGDKILFDSKNDIFVPPQKRKVGFVFQDYALFPNLTVYENLHFALEKGKNKNKINELLKLMDLSALARSYPSKLSGGQCQRVALARALVQEPDILLLDEPLSALDFKMRNFLQDEILKIWKYFKLTILLISHDISEIYKLSQRVIELKNGQITKDTNIKELFKNNLSSEFKITALVIDIEKIDDLVVLILLIGHEFIKVTLNQKEFNEKFSKLKPNDNIILLQKSQNFLLLNMQDYENRT